MRIETSNRCMRSMFSCLMFIVVAIGVIGGSQDEADATLVSITSAALEADQQTLDFNTATLGTIGGTDGLFTDFGISQAYLIGEYTFVDGDIWNSGIDGKGLASRDNTLTIVGLNSRFDGLNGVNTGFGFKLAGTATQLGFQMIDQSGHTTSVQTLLNNVVLDTVTYLATGLFPLPTVFYMQTSGMFDEFRILATPRADSGWGLDNLTLAGRSTQEAPIPEPATIALLGIGLAGLAGAEARRRRKKKAVNNS